MADKFYNLMIDVQTLKTSQNVCIKGMLKGSEGNHLGGVMYNRSGLERTVEKVKVTRIENIFVMPYAVNTSRNKVIKDYIYSPEVRIIA